ncbi:MAG TPA: hypothetical protein VHB77_04015 [Planctomycetaceae bacterium]|nr:hypothetical protein [Planctomycetaceae bacterium]
MPALLLRSFLATALLIAASHLLAEERPSIDAPLPYGQQPIDYGGPDADDRVARLAAELESGGRTLEHREEHGYLRALLEALQIPIESQLLVFSKSSANVQLISPKTPRAIYFNDDVYVGWIPGIEALEISAVDPNKGGMFYTLSQKADGPPRIIRRERCLVCHASQGSLRVPGHLDRSFTTDLQGNLRDGHSRITHDSPLAQRWGGWYVTGTHGTQPHLGNLFGDEAVRQHRGDPTHGGNLTDLSKVFEIDRYPSPHSDIIAHLVLDHQVHGHNLLTRLNYESRLERPSQVHEALVRYLLFADEPRFESPIAGTSGFADWFTRQGARDSRGRSLRTLDLQQRLLKYRLSWLIDSPGVDALPAEAKRRLYQGLSAALTGPNPASWLPADERQAIVEILREIKPDFLAITAAEAPQK